MAVTFKKTGEIKLFKEIPCGSYIFFKSKVFVKTSDKIEQEVANIYDVRNMTMDAVTNGNQFVEIVERMEESYVLSISYSWGDNEPDLKFSSFEKAWKKAKSMAMEEAETASTEHECEIGLTIQSIDSLKEGTISLHYTYDNSYCIYYVCKKIGTETGCDEYYFSEVLNEQLKFWCSGCGELHYHGEYFITKDDLPEPLLMAYENLWSEGAGCLEYIVEYKHGYYLAIEGEYPTDEDKIPGQFEEAKRLAKELLPDFPDCRLIVGHNTGNERNELYFLVPALTEKSVFDQMEKRIIKALNAEE